MRGNGISCCGRIGFLKVFLNVTMDYVQIICVSWILFRYTCYCGLSICKKILILHELGLSQ